MSIGGGYSKISQYGISRVSVDDFVFGQNELNQYTILKGGQEKDCANFEGLSNGGFKTCHRGIFLGAS